MPARVREASTDDPLHGGQEGRFVNGYYKHYCYLPLYIFCGEHLLCARLRTSDRDASNGSVEELEPIVGRIRASWPKVRIVIHGDSGGCPDFNGKIILIVSPSPQSGRFVLREPDPRPNLSIPVVYGDEDERPCALLPEAAFRPDSGTRTDRAAMRAVYGVPDDEIGPNSLTVRWRFFSCTAGWARPPGPADLYEALHTEAPTARQNAVMRAWLQEAKLPEITLAWIEEAYTWRVLVRAIHRLGHTDPRLNRYVNQYAVPTRTIADSGPCSQ